MTSRLHVEVTDPETAHETTHFTDYGDEAEVGDVLLIPVRAAFRSTGRTNLGFG